MLLVGLAGGVASFLDSSGSVVDLVRIQASRNAYICMAAQSVATHVEELKFP